MFTEVISRIPTGFITTDYTIQTVCPQTLHLLALYDSEGKSSVRSCKLPHIEWLIPGSQDDASFKRRECTKNNFYGRTGQGRASGTVNRVAEMSSALRRVKKVKCTLVQALRLCTGRTAHRGSRGIALSFHDHGTRRG